MKVTLVRLTVTILAVATLALYITADKKSSDKETSLLQTATQENEEQEARYTVLRAQYEWNMIKEPVTRRIPARHYQREPEEDRLIHEKGKDPLLQGRGTALNTYYPAGPNDQGGRTRAFAYDIRYNGASNRVLISGGVSGGIMTSADAG